MKSMVLYKSSFLHYITFLAVSHFLACVQAMFIVSLSLCASWLRIIQELQALLRLLAYISSVQLIFCILLHIHTLKASSIFISSFLMVHISDLCSNTLHVIVFISRFFGILFGLPLSNSLLFLENAPFLSLSFF